MPAPRKLPELRELQEFIASGLTYKEIAEEFGVGEQAVYRALARENATDGRPRYESSIPWRVANKHRDNKHLRYLRLLVRQEVGEVLPPDKVRQLDAWKAERVARNHVIGYHRDYPANEASVNGGFYFITRTPEDAGRWARSGTDEGPAELQDDQLRQAQT